MLSKNPNKQDSGSGKSVQVVGVQAKEVKPLLDAVAGEGLADTPSQIIELNDGRCFLACELWKGWDNTRPLHIRGLAVFSDDQGQTWADRVDLPSATDRMYSHSRYTQLIAHFGLNNLRIRGLTQVAQYILARCLAYLACTIVAHEVGRPDLKASPSRLLYSY